MIEPSVREPDKQLDSLQPAAYGCSLPLGSGFFYVLRLVSCRVRFPGGSFLRIAGIAAGLLPLGEPVRT